VLLFVEKVSDAGVLNYSHIMAGSDKYIDHLNDRKHLNDRIHLASRLHFIPDVPESILTENVLCKGLEAITDKVSVKEVNRCHVKELTILLVKEWGQIITQGFDVLHKRLVFVNAGEIDNFENFCSCGALSTVFNFKDSIVSVDMQFILHKENLEELLEETLILAQTPTRLWPAEATRRTFILSIVKRQSMLRDRRLV